MIFPYDRSKCFSEIVTEVLDAASATDFHFGGLAANRSGETACVEFYPFVIKAQEVDS
jgi:hypothetical protein